MDSETLYRVNGGEPAPVDKINWGDVSPWDHVDAKVPGCPWAPVYPGKPLLLSEVPALQASRSADPQNRYRLDGPLWPPRAPS